MNKKIIITTITLIIFIILGVFAINKYSTYVEEKNIEEAKIDKQNRNDEFVNKTKVEYEKKRTEEITQELTSSGLAPNLNIQQLKEIYLLTGSGAFKRFNDSKNTEELSIHPITIKEVRGKSIGYNTQVAFTVKDFLVPYMNEEFQNGKIKVYTQTGTGAKNYIEVSDRLLVDVEGVYDKYDTTLYIGFTASDKLMLSDLLKNATFIGIEGSGVRGYHSDLFNFDYKTTIKLLDK